MKMVSRILLSSAVAGIAYPTVIQAQEAQRETIQLEDIIVTARKRDESLLETPVTVSAFTNENLDSRQITSIQDLANVTPGFLTTNTGGTPGAAGGSRADRSTQSFLVRGIINRTSLFIDGAPVASGFAEGVSDLERVEIIKGPQSAYFGRATFVGAVNLVTKVPSETLAGSVNATLGTDRWHDVRASLEGPLIPGKLSGRVSVRDYSMRGQYRNAGGPERYLGSQSTRSVSASLYATPSDYLTMRLTGIVWRDSDGPPATGKFRRIDYNCNAGGAPAGQLNYICGTLPSFPEERLGQDAFITPNFLNTVLKNVPGLLTPINNDPPIDHGGLERRAFHANLGIDYEIPGSGLTISSITAGNRNAMYIINDLDIQATTHLPNPSFGAPYTEPYNNWLMHFQYLTWDVSQELRLASDQEGRFRWLVGGNYYYTSNQFYSAAIRNQGLSVNARGAPTISETIGGFASAAFDFTPQLTLNLEGRYQTDKIKQYDRTLLAGKTLAAKTRYNNFTPRAILQFRPNEDGMIYLSYSEGINPGVFNTQLITAHPIQLAAVQAIAGSDAKLAVDPEKLINYEAGIKGKFFNNRLQLQIAGYYAIWKDQIVSQNIPVPSLDSFGVPNGGTSTFGVSTNVGETVIKGIELEGLWQVTNELVVNFAGAINDSEIKKYDCIAPCVAITGRSDVRGNELPLYAKYNGSIGAEYTQAIGDDLDGYMRADYNFRSGMWDTFSNVVKTQFSHKVNLRAGIKTDRYRFEAFVMNLLDDDAFVSIERNVDVLSPGFADNVLNVGMPMKRQFGIRASYNFGGQ